MKKKLHICLSLDIEVEAEANHLNDDETTLLRVQSAFDPDDHGRLDTHAEAVAHHLERLVGWAVMTREVKRLEDVRARIITQPTTEKAIQAIVLVDCLITQEVKP
jgi:hypothetical protein